MLGGAGVEVARFKWAVLGFALEASAMVNGGVLIAGDLGATLAFD